MAREWGQFTLGDLCSMITDGKHGDCEDQPNSGFYFLSVKDVIGNRLVYENARQITERDFSETHRRTDLQPGDVLFTNTGTIGRMAIAQNDPRTYRTTFQKSVAILKPRRNLINPHFLYYALHFDNLKLSEFAAGTTQKNLLLKDLRAFALQVPPLIEQESIINILRKLDDKIELNRRMNETLETMARALFKSWFVDFDPVRAKAEGHKPFGMDAETAALFPHSFQDSPLGKIPKPWEVRAIGDVVTVVGGSTPRTDQPGFWEGTVNFATPKDMSHLRTPILLETERRITESGVQQISSGLLPEGTVLLSSRAPIGYLAMAEVPVTVNQGIIAMICDKELSNLYVLQWTKENLEAIIANANGTTFLEISKSNFRPIKVLVPSAPVLSRFVRFVEPLYRRMVNNVTQTNTLTAIRDTLLPKLMSGEIRVKASE
jgi:type I restriction enzyme S subunit